MATLARSADLSTQKAGLEARLAFVNGLFDIQTTQSGAKQWQVSLLFPKTADLGPLKELAMQVAKEAWGDKAEQKLADGLIKSPFLDGDGPQGKSKKTGEPHKGFPGHVFIRCTSGEDYRPKLLNGQLLPIADKSELKSGDYGYAVVNAYAWNSPKQGDGISFGISMVLKSRDGESLGGGGVGAAEEYFEKIEDQGAAPEESKSGDGAAGFFG